MHSIRVKIIAVTVAAILISNLTFLAVYFMTVAKESSRLSAERLDLMTQNLAKSLDSYLDSIDQSVDLAAYFAVDSLDTLQLMEAGVYGGAEGESGRKLMHQATLANYLSQYIEGLKSTFLSLAGNSHGVVSFYFCLNPEVSPVEHGLAYSRVGKAGFEEQTPPDARWLSPDDPAHTWYFTTIKRGRPSWIGPYQEPGRDNAWTLSYLTPIYKSGVLIGVLGMDIPFETLTEQIEALQVYETGFAFLLDENYRILCHPTLETGSLPEGAEELLQSVLLRQSGGSSEPLRYEKGGEKWQLSYATLSSGMHLMVTAPVREITASWYRLVEIIFIVTAANILLFSVLTLLFIRAFTRPLQRLTAASRRLSAGEYDVELDYEGQDEVGLLTMAFRQMRDHLKLYISDLNSRAYSDALTGVKNKGAFDIYAGRLDDAIRHGESGQTAFAIVMFDCNGLKKINDSHGHNCGDEFLTGTCGLICQVFAHSPVFRLGGDEFAVLLQRQDYVQRDALLAEFDKRVEEVNASASQPWERIDVARGLSVFRSGQDSGSAQVLKRADERMYENKRRSGAARD